MGWTSENYSSSFWDKAEEIPGGYIIQREIRKAISGEDFFVNNEKGKPVNVKGVDQSDFYYYFNIWDDYVHFGLPSGRGSLYERRWLLDFLKTFDAALSKVKNLREEQAARK